MSTSRAIAGMRTIRIMTSIIMRTIMNIIMNMSMRIVPAATSIMRTMRANAPAAIITSRIMRITMRVLAVAGMSIITMTVAAAGTITVIWQPMHANV